MAHVALIATAVSAVLQVAGGAAQKSAMYALGDSTMAAAEQNSYIAKQNALSQKYATDYNIAVNEKNKQRLILEEGLNSKLVRREFSREAAKANVFMAAEGQTKRDLLDTLALDRELELQALSHRSAGEQSAMNADSNLQSFQGQAALASGRYQSASILAEGANQKAAYRAEGRNALMSGFIGAASSIAMFSSGLGKAAGKVKTPSKGMSFGGFNGSVPSRTFDFSSVKSVLGAA